MGGKNKLFQDGGRGRPLDDRHAGGDYKLSRRPKRGKFRSRPQEAQEVLHHGGTCTRASTFKEKKEKGVWGKRGGKTPASS